MTSAVSNHLGKTAEEATTWVLPLEPFAYASLATPFGTGYHFVAMGQGLARDAKDRAALAEICNTIAQAGDPQGVLHAGASTRDERGCWVWLRASPQQDWQGRPGVFIAGLAARWSDLDAASERGAPWTVRLSALPFPTIDEVKQALAKADARDLRQGLFLPSGSAKIATWPQSEDLVALADRLPGLFVGARRLAEGDRYHLVNDGTAEQVLPWLGLLQPAATRAGFSFAINAPARLSWPARLTWWSDAAGAPAGENRRLWGRSPTLPPEAAPLAKLLVERAQAGTLVAADFRVPGAVRTAEEYWQALVSQSRWANLMARPELVRDCPAEEVVQAINYAIESGNEAKMAELARHATATPAVFVRAIEIARGHAAALPSRILATLPPGDLLREWRECLPVTPGLVDLLWSLWNEHAASSDWQTLSVDEALQLPATARYRWLAGIAAREPARLLGHAQLRTDMLGLAPEAVRQEDADAIIRVLLAGDPRTAALSWESKALRAHLRPEHAASLPFELLRGNEVLVRDHLGGDVSWVMAVWRANAGEARWEWRRIAAEWLLDRLHELPQSDRLDVLAAAGTDQARIPPYRAGVWKEKAELSIRRLPSRDDRAEARKAWPILATEHFQQRESRGAEQRVPPSVWIGVGGVVLLATLAFAIWHFAFSPIDDLAQQEADSENLLVRERADR